MVREKGLVLEGAAFRVVERGERHWYVASMSCLSPSADAAIKNRFASLQAEAKDLLTKMTEEHRRSGRIGITYCSEDFACFRTKLLNLVHYLGLEARYGDEIHKAEAFVRTMEHLLGIVRGLTDDYENGFLDSLQRRVEAALTADYLGQAERLLGEGASGRYDHMPAAVLLGAVLEKSLRTLCERQTPPLPVLDGRGVPKTLNPLIDDLKKAGVFDELRAKHLRTWAGIRNAAAHGEFDKIGRTDVEMMARGVEAFLAEAM